MATIIWLISPEEVTQAYQSPPPFLGPVYYGANPVSSVFDHNLPVTYLGSDQNNFVDNANHFL
jgi:hypothetical protein